MRKNEIRIMILLVLLTVFSSGQQVHAKEKPSYVDLVNPLMGTDSNYKLSTGNTYPAVALPWGMNFWTPQTGKMGDGWGYTYHSYKIRGIKQTHQPSPWINDYAAFSLMPETGKLIINEDKRASWFSHKAEISKPSYYSVYLADYDVTAEVTPTQRAAVFRFTYPKSNHSYLLIDGFFKGSKVQLSPDGKTITGYCRNNSGGVPDNFHNYFVIKIDKPCKITYTWKGDQLKKNSTEAEGEHVGAVVEFQTYKGEQVHVKVASSFISLEQARLNLKREVGNKSFGTVLAEANEAWNKTLGRVAVEGGTLAQQKTFYSCLYRAMLFPRKFYEIDANNKIVHYSPYNGKVLPGYMFTDNGFWDTFRAEFPFLTIMYPTMDSHVMQGLVNAYLESGWLPEWASPGHRNCMIGTNSASIIADAYMKGIRGYNIDTLYQAMLKDTKGPNPKVSSTGRLGANYYNKLGYVPYNVGINENAARTLEYAYDDFCIWRVARAIGRPRSEVNLFAQRAQNYRNVFDPETKLMRGRNEDGTFESPFNPLKWGDAFTEGNSLHYTWSVFQDIHGLIGLMGGKKNFIDELDTVFTMPPKFDCSYYGQVIHEIREMQIANMGNYAHGNQPIQHMIYLYDYAGEPWKAQYHLRDVMNKLYAAVPDGYCGDEDNGQTSAWYVFSALGFYSVCPGSNQYALGAPLFNKITLSLENGKTFTIKAPDNSAKNFYVKDIKLNRKKRDKNYITHQDIMNGGTLLFNMDSKPNKYRGIKDSDFPYSMSTDSVE